VDAELSPLVRRTFTLAIDKGDSEERVLRTVYEATTNRMLRVAVNGFMESIGTVLSIMEELDGDVIAAKGKY
jgi:EKC/KEOPS complex subunit PCC1/LAGE3